MGELSESIAVAGTKIPEVSSAIEEGKASKAQLDGDLAKHKDDRAAAKESLAEATALREKEAAAYASTKAGYGENIAALEKATAAISKGMVGAFLQTADVIILRKLAQTSQ